MDNNLLRKVLNEKLNIINHINSVELLEKNIATLKGQNFGSTMFRVKIKYNFLSKENVEEEKFIHLISKEEPPAGIISKIVNDMNAFGNESEILIEILPQIEQLVGQKIGPKIFYYSINPKIILMEDLIFEGFQNKDAAIGLTKSQMLMVIKSFAMFHAGSVAINEMNPGCFKKYRLSILNEFCPESLYELLENSMRNLSQAIKEWGGETSLKIANKFDKLAGVICQQHLNDAKYDDDEFCVLNHGDCWVNNMMFKDDENGELLEVRLIDYQVIVWTSPAIDLLTLLSVCPKLDILCDLDDYFIKEYLEILKSTMKKLNCKTVPPTVDSLKKSMLKRSIRAIVTGLVHQSRNIATASTNESTFKEALDNVSADINIFKLPSVEKFLKKVVPIFDQRGYLD